MLCVTFHNFFFTGVGVLAIHALLKVEDTLCQQLVEYIHSCSPYSFPNQVPNFHDIRKRISFESKCLIKRHNIANDSSNNFELKW